MFEQIERPDYIFIVCDRLPSTQVTKNSTNTHTVHVPQLIFEIRLCFTRDRTFRFHRS